MCHKKLDNFSYCWKFSVFLKQQNFAGDLGQCSFNVFSLLKSEYRYKSMDLLFIRGIINFKTIYTFLEQRFDEKEIFALSEHLKILIKNLLLNSMIVAL
jgi:hypothetical protein